MEPNPHRIAWVLDRVRKGWPQEIIGQASWGIHPFDNHPVPPRKLEKQVRKRSLILLKEVQGLSLDFVSHSKVEGRSLDFVSYSKLVAHALRDYADFGRKFDADDFSAHWERLASELENYQQST